MTIDGNFDPSPQNNLVTFVWEIPDQEDPFEVEAEVVDVTNNSIRVRVPVGILGDRSNLKRFPSGTRRAITIRVQISPPGAQPVLLQFPFILILPRPLIYDELSVVPLDGGHPILQSTLSDANDVDTYWFLGRSVDGRAGLRVKNTRLTQADASSPLNLNGQTLVFGLDSSPIGNSEIEGRDRNDDTLQMMINQDGLYVITVQADPTSTFPNPYQIHLSGDTSSPQSVLPDGIREGARAIRRDILYNHPAPRWERLVGADNGIAHNTPFKFPKREETSPYAKAVLIPPTVNGFTIGESDPSLYIRRAKDPDVTGQLRVVDITNPLARTPSLGAPELGEVIDFTQLPSPASAIEAAAVPNGAVDSIDGTVGAVIGMPNIGLSLKLPLTLPSGEISSLILDLGSGHEAINQEGNDLRVHAVGNYTVAVGNTPFVNDLVPFPGVAADLSDFDLNEIGLSSARYVRITASPNVQLDAIQALNIYYEDAFFDELRGINVPIARANSITFSARREKAPVTEFDPVLELIDPDGRLNLPIADQGFGDPTSVNLTDTALVKRGLNLNGFYRVVGRGDRNPIPAAFGSYSLAWKPVVTTI